MRYCVTTIVALPVLDACYSQLAIVLAMRRHDGMLKRVRATRLPAWTYFLDLLAHCVVVSVIDIALIVGIGRLFGVAPAVVQFVLFPLLFISGTYFPIHSAVLDDVVGVLPVRPFNQAVPGPPSPSTPGSTGTTSACWLPGAPSGRLSPSAASGGTLAPNAAISVVTGREHRGIAPRGQPGDHLPDLLEPVAAQLGRAQAAAAEHPAPTSSDG